MQNFFIKFILNFCIAFKIDIWLPTKNHTIGEKYLSVANNSKRLWDICYQCWKIGSWITPDRIVACDQKFERTFARHGSTLTKVDTTRNRSCSLSWHNNENGTPLLKFHAKGRRSYDVKFISWYSAKISWKMYITVHLPEIDPCSWTNYFH